MRKWRSPSLPRRSGEGDSKVPQSFDHFRSLRHGRRCRYEKCIIYFCPARKRVCHNCWKWRLGVLLFPELQWRHLRPLRAQADATLHLGWRSPHCLSCWVVPLTDHGSTSSCIVSRLRMLLTKWSQLWRRLLLRTGYYTIIETPIFHTLIFFRISWQLEPKVV